MGQTTAALHLVCNRMFEFGQIGEQRTLGDAMDIGGIVFLDAGGGGVGGAACRLAEEGSWAMPRPPEEDEHVDEFFRC